MKPLNSISGKYDFRAKPDHLLTPRNYIHLLRGENRLNTFTCYDPHKWTQTLEAAKTAMHRWTEVFYPHELRLEPSDTDWSR